MQRMGGHVLQIMAGDGACALLHIHVQVCHSEREEAENQH